MDGNLGTDGTFPCRQNADTVQWAGAHPNQNEVPCPGFARA
jgi:hypothetical protein